MDVREAAQQYVWFGAALILVGACSEAPGDRTGTTTNTWNDEQAATGLPGQTQPGGQQPGVPGAAGTEGTVFSESPGAGGTGGSGLAGSGGMAGAPSLGGDSGLAPIVRDPSFPDHAPALGEPLPAGAAGTWTYLEVPGAVCRDGSPAGLYYRYSDASPNYYIYLEGGGVCLDDFFCGINPLNVNETMNAESVIMGATGKLAVKQAPGGEGIFKQDPRNPVADWNGIYVPYCTGDIWGGNRPNATFPAGVSGLHVDGMHQFVGFSNTSLMLGRIAATFPDADKALLTGSSAGGIGALLNSHRFADLLGKVAPQTRAFVVSDSAVPFADKFLAACTQNYWRELWGLNQSFPSDCANCFPADGGNLAPGLAEYFRKKFPDEQQVLGGLISSVDDEIIKLFYSANLPGCTGTQYAAGAYQAALEDFRDNIAGRDRFGSYFIPGTLHMHLWRPRFYENNGVSMSVADWLTKILNNEPAHVAP